MSGEIKLRPITVASCTAKTIKSFVNVNVNVYWAKRFVLLHEHIKWSKQVEGMCLIVLTTTELSLYSIWVWNLYVGIILLVRNDTVDCHLQLSYFSPNFANRYISHWCNFSESCLESCLWHFQAGFWRTKWNF